MVTCLIVHHTSESLDNQIASIYDVFGSVYSTYIDTYFVVALTVRVICGLG